MKNVSIVMTALAAMYLGGCATVTRGTTETYYIESNPTGQEVRLSNSMVCVTPCELVLPRKQSLTATFENGCSADITSKLSHGANVGAATANVLLLGPVGAFVHIADSSSGALNNLVPNPLVVSTDTCQVHEEEQVASL